MIPLVEENSLINLWIMTVNVLQIFCKIFAKFRQNLEIWCMYFCALLLWAVSSSYEFKLSDRLILRILVSYVCITWRRTKLRVRLILSFVHRFSLLHYLTENQTVCLTHFIVRRFSFLHYSMEKEVVCLTHLEAHRFYSDFFHPIQHNRFHFLH